MSLLSVPILGQHLPMFETVRTMWPEIALFVATCLVMVLGLSPRLATRRLTAWVCGAGLLAAGVLACYSPPGRGLMPDLLPYAKVLVAGMGLLLLLVNVGTVDREEEALIASGRVVFNPLRTNRAEFYAFFLFSLTGVMLCAGADDLVWLFLALELTSLPTYIMVTISRTGRNGARGQEAGVKYFFLGALGAAVFLYGFALMYGGTGTTSLSGIRDAMLAQSNRAGGINPIAMAGLVLALIGVGFKIAAVPMHLYTPDVYEGAASPVSAFLAFVPKTAGFFAIILLCSTAGWRHERAPGGEMTSLPEMVRLTLWVMAALSMTWGNVLAILQSNVKRMLAYSSIAHSGYMLVGVIAGPGEGNGSIVHNGLAAVLFYLLVYGVSNLGAFAVLACLERRSRETGEEAEIETVEDLRGLCATHPVLGWTMVLSALSLMGFPPLLGFFGKVPLFTSAINNNELALVVVLGLNSAIAAYYYLRLVFVPYLETSSEEARASRPVPFATRPAAAMISAGGVVVLAVAADWLMRQSAEATRPAAALVVPAPASATPATPVEHGGH